MSTIDIRDDFLDALKELDNLLTKDPFQRDILWKVIESYIQSDKKTDELALSLNRIYNSDVGNIIEFLLQDSQITNNLFIENNNLNFQNSSYFIALSEVFIFPFRRKRMLEIHPLFLEMLSWESEDVLNIKRADGTNLSIYTDISTLIYIMRRMLQSLEVDLESITEDELKNLMKHAFDLHEMIAPFVNFEDDDKSGE